MKKFLVSITVILGFSVYALRGQWPKFSGEGGEAKTLTANQNTALITLNTNSSSTPVNNRTNDTQVNTNTGVSRLGNFTDGKYTGSVADAFYGNVQVAITVSSGRLSTVQVLQYPSDQRHSLEVSNYALPYLKTEAIQAQSAQIDIISGATDTSFAFRESLQTALTKAGG